MGGKPTAPGVAIALALLLATPVLAGCIGDAGQSAETASTPDSEAADEAEDWARSLPDEVTGIEHLTQVEDVEAAGGLWTDGDYAYVSGQNTGFYVVDLTTPNEPQVVGEIKDQFTRDVAMLHDGNRSVVVTAASGGGMVFIDVTEPTQPEVVGEALGGGEGNVHNANVVPGTHLVYNSRSVDTPGVDIVNASNPANPEHVATFNDLTCHDITFSAEDDRAYCAGVRETQIWDISDPEDPDVLTRIYNPFMHVHHWATVTNGGDLLVIGDEFGGSTDAAAGCYATADNPTDDHTVSDPYGAVWFYDISDESQPVPLGWVAPELPANNVPPTPCTAHFGEILPNQDKMVIGWRAAGTYVVDFSDPSAPELVDHVTPVGDNWETRYHNGYVFSGDTDRGMDVFVPTGS
jgi:hypothetical protein